MQQQRLAGLAVQQAQRGRDLDTFLRRARRLRADQRVGAVAIEALLSGLNTEYKTRDGQTENEKTRPAET